MRKNYEIRKKCVLCESKKLKRVLNFNKTPLANSYVKSIKVKENYYPLVCILCLDCKHLQLQHIVKPKVIFEDYMYVSGTSQVLVNHFQNYFKKIKKNYILINLKTKFLILPVMMEHS